MSSELFRQEALDANRSSWLGEIDLAPTPRHQAIAVFLIVLVALGLVVIGRISFTDKSVVSGRVVTSELRWGIERPDANARVRFAFDPDRGPVRPGDELLGYVQSKGGVDSFNLRVVRVDAPTEPSAAVSAIAIAEGLMPESTSRVLQIVVPGRRRTVAESLARRFGFGCERTGTNSCT